MCAEGSAMPNTFKTPQQDTPKGPIRRVYIMEPWEKFTALHENILKLGDSQMVTIRGDVITLRCWNGRASYRLTSFDQATGTYAAELAESTFEPPPANIRP